VYGIRRSVIALRCLRNNAVPQITLAIVGITIRPRVKAARSSDLDPRPNRKA
jgi:hypothetical protein